MSKCKTGLKNYKQGNKNNWRRTIWNEIANRVEDRWGATVLYLASEQDLDRKVAVEKGFNPNKLFICDINKHVIEKHKANGKLAIHGDIFDVARNYNGCPEVIIADLCCGLKPEIMNAVLNLFIQKLLFNKCVFCINMLRGREYLFGASDPVMFSELIKKDNIIVKHRGKILFSCIQNRIICQIIISDMVRLFNISSKDATELFCNSHYHRKVACEHIYGEYINRCRQVGIFGNPEILENAHETYIKNKLNPYFYNYHSGPQVFDTLLVSSYISYNANTNPTVPTNKVLSKKISALKAISTMRNNGTLQYCPTE